MSEERRNVCGQLYGLRPLRFAKYGLQFPLGETLVRPVRADFRV